MLAEGFDHLDDQFAAARHQAAALVCLASGLQPRRAGVSAAPRIRSHVRGAAKAGEKKDIGWGSQIRSYVFQPYTMVNDHRTEVKVGDVQRVMDGDLDPFIQAYLKRFGGKAA